MTATQKTIRNLLLGLTLSGSTMGFAATVARAVGSGIVYPTLNHASVLNPAGLSESPSASLQGLYDFDDKNIFGSATIGQNGFGAGFDYTRLDATSSSNEHFGVGAKLGSFMLGATLSSVEFGGFDYSIGTMFEMSKVRLAAVVNGIKGGVDDVGFGLGTEMGMWGVEADIFHDFGTGSKNNEFSFNLGLHARLDMLSLGVGYKFTMTGTDFTDDGAWGGLSLAIGHNAAIEAFYKAGGTSLKLGDWSAGARFQF